MTRRTRAKTIHSSSVVIFSVSQTSPLSTKATGPSSPSSQLRSEDRPSLPETGVGPVYVAGDDHYGLDADGGE
jgi:hypothetical protein